MVRKKKMVRKILFKREYSNGIIKVLPTIFPYYTIRLLFFSGYYFKICN